ncbi:hypothetical protein E2C01_000872 [Portunus trituberculatus]|uniref:Uncharacterized protein n=1 Tax=Portunus trituberculatus TaxID=210409 RepID=A0A5B7CG74_PORTR|nr:hypothetical protein [Portunus trituberculatus]
MRNRIEGPQRSGNATIGLLKASDIATWETVTATLSLLTMLGGINTLVTPSPTQLSNERKNYPASWYTQRGFVSPLGLLTWEFASLR